MPNILRHDYKPAPIIKWVDGEDERTTLTLGVEQEIDGVIGRERKDREETAEKILSVADGRVYIKNDGSLNNCGAYSGMEIVTHPGSLMHHMKEMHWTGICNKATKAGYRAHTAKTCGLHVHVGREQLGATEADRDDVIRKLTAFIYLHWEETRKFTRRSNYAINRWARMNLDVKRAIEYGFFDIDWAKENLRTHNTHEDRYEAINCENRATVEFRIFRGTAKRDTLIAALQFVSNVCLYCRSHSWEEVFSASFLDVVQFVEWNELNAYLYHREFVDDMILPFRTARIPEFKGVDGSKGRETNPRRARINEPDEDPA